MLDNQNKTKQNQMNDQEQKPKSILDEDTSDVDTSLPLLPGKVEMLFTVSDLEQSVSEKSGADLINITLKTAEAARDVTDTRDIGKGFPVFDTISITPTEKYAKDAILRRLANFQRACGFKDGTFMSHIHEYKGSIVRVVVGISKETDEYPARNKVSRYVEPED